MPIYLGYYVTHRWGASKNSTENTYGESFMRFSPHSTSGKDPIKSVNGPRFPKKTFKIAMETENVENGELIALILAISIAVAFFVFVSYVVIVTYINTKDFLYLLIGLPGVTVVTVIGYFILYWILLAILMPGDSLVKVDSKEDAVAKVSTTQLTFLGLASFVIYKLCGKKEDT